MNIRLCGLMMIFALAGAGTFSVFAQPGLTVRLSSPDTSQFPIVQAFLDVHDPAGQFIHGLKPEQVTVLEDGNNLPVSEIEELRPGLQLVVAINPGPSFAIRNFQAVSRFDLIKDGLQSWAESRLGTTTDDWSLLVSGGSAISHTSDPAQFIAGLESIQLDAPPTQPTIDTLARAVTLASDPTPRSGMGKAVLFITSTIDGELDQPIKDISDQARQQDIPISVWLVASSGASTIQSSEKLSELATSSGGQVFNFSGEETFPKPDQSMDALRDIYRITYSSKVGLSGEHEVSALVQLVEEQVQSNTQTFQVNIQPLEPAFISPPISIERILPETAENANKVAPADGTETGELLFPKEIPLQVVFDFPDGRKRDLINSALLVNGIVVAENLTPPYDQFIWNLENFSSDSLVNIQVQATDILGMTGSSIEMPVEIKVAHPEKDPWFVVRRNLVTISLLLVLMAGGLLFLVLVLGGRLRPLTQIAISQTKAKKTSKNPIPTIVELPQNRVGWVSRLQRPYTASIPDPLAYFSRVVEEGELTISSPIPITSDDNLLGTDPNRANILIKDSCIEGVHARLKHTPEGEFWLFDQGSIAGTWVNYTPITQEGVRLQPGDVVHFGRIGFNFSINDVSRVLKPKVSLENPIKTENSEAMEDDIEEDA